PDALLVDRGSAERVAGLRAGQFIPLGAGDFEAVEVEVDSEGSTGARTRSGRAGDRRRERIDLGFDCLCGAPLVELGDTAARRDEQFAAADLLSDDALVDTVERSRLRDALLDRCCRSRGDLG